MRYRSRPAEVEAERWEPDNAGEKGMDGGQSYEQRAAEIVAWVNANGGEARYEAEPVARIGGRGHGVQEFVQAPRIAVRTINGWAYAAPGHYVVMGTATFLLNYGGGGTHERRDFYPCDPETFERRWEPEERPYKPSIPPGAVNPLAVTYQPIAKETTHGVPVDVELERDVLLFGTAFERRHPDGRRERLDPTEVIVHSGQQPQTGTIPDMTVAPLESTP